MKPLSPHTKIALITGGCRRVGAAISGHLARQGWALALHGHSDTQPEDSLARILEIEETPYAGFKADLLDAQATRVLVADIAQHFGRAPDLIVNNASLFEDDAIDTLSAEAMEAHWRIHVLAPTLLTQALFKQLAPEQQANIVHIVDQRVRNPHGDQLSYTLSKQAMAETIRTLARACAPQLRVNGVAPGMTLETEDYAAGQMDAIADMMPLKRNSTPEDIAIAVAYIAGAKAMTGQLLYIDGGAHLESYQQDFVYLAGE